MAGKGHEYNFRLSVPEKGRAGFSLVLLLAFMAIFTVDRISAQPPSKTMAWAPLSSAKLMAVSQGSFSYGSQPSPARSIDLHHFDDISCLNCHGSEDPIEASRADRDLNVDINRTCATYQCHNYDKNLNHPVGITVSSNTPDFMPLDKNSQITCLTCHDQNYEDTNDSDTSRKMSRTLQVPQDDAVCQSCHQKMGFNDGKELHWQFSKKAHLGKINRNSKHDKQTSSFSFGGNVDRESETCVGCHEDVNITIPGLYETTHQKKQRYQNMSDHPIGMNYEGIYNRDAGRYKAVHTTSNGVRLFDGNVGCGSCHSLYSQKKAFLITENQDSELCRKCHIG